MLALGTTAPEFSLPDVASGQTVSLADFANKKALLVMFVCAHCPYVVHVQPELARLAGRRGRKDRQQVIEAAGPEQYDQWLLEYLKSTTARYEPKAYSGRITLFRSTHEPTGWMFDPLAGWGRYAQGGIELAMVEGNHFTMFQDPGATQMAERIDPPAGLFGDCQTMPIFFANSKT